MHTPALQPASPVDLFLHAAGRRRCIALWTQQLPLATNSFLAAVILLLLLGMESLPPVCWFALGIVPLAVVLLRLRRERLPVYQLAQTIDERLGASDALATAWFVLHGSRTISPVAASIQLAGAERLAQSVDVPTLFPLGSSRKRWTVPLVLSIVVLGLAGIRLVSIGPVATPAALLRTPISRSITKKAASKVAERSKRENVAERHVVPVRPKIPDGSATALDGKDVPASLPGASGSPAKGNTDGTPGTVSKKTHDFSTSVQKPNEAGPGTSDLNERNDETVPEPNNQAPNATSDARTDTQNADPNDSSAFSRMKDALSSLLSKLEGGPKDRKNITESKDGTDSPKAHSGNGEQHGTKQGNTAEQEGGAQPSSENGKAQPAEGASGESTKASSKSDAAANGKSDATNANRSEDQEGGAGHQNGDKSLHDAEQLQALGKLQKILGKRAQQVTGDMSVETSWGTQQLQTQFSGRTAHHKDLGGEIHNDEVPPQLQNYVKEYMTHVHDEANRAR